MSKVSPGLMMYRLRAGKLQVLLAHLGGNERFVQKVLEEGLSTQ